MHYYPIAYRHIGVIPGIATYFFNDLEQRVARGMDLQYPMAEVRKRVMWPARVHAASYDTGSSMWSGARFMPADRERQRGRGVSCAWNPRSLPYLSRSP
ncbi:MAG: hypothetical protein ACI9W4_000850 [Rhodothermales bacterium]|jgi:hypothetical protein